MDWRKTNYQETERGDYLLRVEKKSRTTTVFSLLPAEGGKVVGGGWRPNLQQAREAAIAMADLLTSRKAAAERRNPVCEHCGADGRGGAFCPETESGEHIWHVPGIPNMLGKE